MANTSGFSPAPHNRKAGWRPVRRLRAEPRQAAAPAFPPIQQAAPGRHVPEPAAFRRATVSPAWRLERPPQAARPHSVARVRSRGQSEGPALSAAGAIRWDDGWGPAPAPAGDPRQRATQQPQLQCAAVGGNPRAFHQPGRRLAATDALSVDGTNPSRIAAGARQSAIHSTDDRP